MSVLLGNGDGKFSHSGIPIGEFFASLVVVDFNRDGKNDIAALSGGSDDVTILKGNGNSAFAVQPVSFAAGRRPVQLVHHQFNDDNGDGKIDENDLVDLAAINEDGESVSVLLGKGDGTFQPQTRFDVPGTPPALVAADFNRDGRTDLAAVSSDFNSAALLLNVGNGNFADAANNPTGGIEANPIVADLNGDHVADLASCVSRAKSSSASVAARTPETFAPPRVLNANSPARSVASSPIRQVRPGPRSGWPRSTRRRPFQYTVGPRGDLASVQRLFLPEEPLLDQVASADLNGDGLGDLVVSAPGQATLVLFLGTATGGFLPAWRCRLRRWERTVRRDPCRPRRGEGPRLAGDEPDFRRCQRAAE